MIRRCGLVALVLANAIAAQAFVIRDVTVLGMDGQGAVEHRDLLVFDGRVRALGEHGSVVVPDGTATIDGAGRWLIPGLCDMHVHLTDRAELMLYVAHGVTTVRNMWGGPDTLALRERIARRELLGPTVFTTGPIADGPDPRWPGSARVLDAAAARSFVAEHVEAGYDAVKVYDDLGAEPYLELLMAAAESGLPVVGHVPREVGLRGAIASGQRSLEHLRGWDDIGDGSLDAMASRCADAGVWNCPTLVVLDLPWVALRDIEFARALPEMALVPPSIRARWDPATDARFGGVTAVDDELWSAHLERMARARRVVKALYDAGAPMLVGTDAPNPFVVPGHSFHRELESLCEAGLAPADVLRMATLDAARFLGREDAGSIAVGQVADLVLLDEDPLADVAAARSIAGVAVGGRWLSRSDLDDALAELVDGYAQPADWFATMPAIEGEELLQFEVTWNGQSIGAERVAVDDGEPRRATGQSVYRDGFLERRASFRLEGGRRGGSLAIDAAHGEREGRIELRSEAGAVAITGTTPAGQSLDEHSELAPDSTLGPGILVHAILFAPRLLDLAVGEHAEFELRTPELEETFELSTTRVRAERTQDASRASGGERVPVSVYRLRLTTGAWVTRGTLTLADGRPVTLELVFPQGHKVFRR